MAASNPLESTGASGDEFQKKILAGRAGTPVNIDTIFHTRDGYQVVEFLRDAREPSSNNPHTSHPSRYWAKNWRKFSALNAITRGLGGTLWLINYSEVNEKVRVFQVRACGQFLQARFRALSGGFRTVLCEGPGRLPAAFSSFVRKRRTGNCPQTLTSLKDGPGGGIQAKSWETTFEHFQDWYVKKFVEAATPAWEQQ